MSPFSPICDITQRDADGFVQGMFGRDKDTKAALQRLDRLAIDEARTTAAEILRVVYSLVQDMSKQTFYTSRLPAIEFHSS